MDYGLDGCIGNGVHNWSWTCKEAHLPQRTECHLLLWIRDIYIYRTASTSQSDQTCAGLKSPSYSWHWYRGACPDLQHLWLNDYRPRNPSSRFLQLSLPGRTLSRHIAWRRSLHSILIRRRWQYGPVWTSRRRCPVKEIRICPHTSSPATVSRRWIRYGVDVLVPTSRSLLYS